MPTNQRTHRTHNGMEKGEPSVRVVAPTALDTAQLQELLCGWWADRKELWDDQYNGLGSRDSAGG